ncbi:MAG: hypothetical protein JWO05_1928 [Gemmatimonadetes bacterium]|nr:hypothetical protein [Gemmatimonadota bacterium]
MRARSGLVAMTCAAILVLVCARATALAQARARPSMLARDRWSVAGASSAAQVAPIEDARISPPRLRRLPAWSAPLLSAVVPGAGQAVVGQERFVAYAATEGFFWVEFLKNRAEANRQRRTYRELANRVARGSFSDAAPDGDWDYYERLEHYLESGVYSQGGPLVVPETDESTFNGAVWLLARRTYFANPTLPPARDTPQYQAALAFYERRAARPEFRWSWRNAQLEQDVYRRTINKANDGFRRATTDLSVILANHILSAVDAFGSVRLQLHGSAMSGYRAQVTIPLGGTSK